MKGKRRENKWLKRERYITEIMIDETWRKKNKINELETKQNWEKYEGNAWQENRNKRKYYWRKNKIIQ